MLEPPSRFNPKYAVPVVAALALVAVGIGLEFSRRSPEAPARKLILPAPVAEGLGPQSSSAITPAGEEAGDLKDDGEDGGADDAAVSAFLDLLRPAQKDPKARAVSLALTEEFRKVPELRKAHEEFLKLPPERRRPREFLGRVGEMPQFHQLVARFMASPGVGGVLPIATVVKPRDINEIAREWKQKGTGQGTDVNRALSAREAARRHPALASIGPASRFGAAAAGGGAAQAAGTQAFGGAGRHIGAVGHSTLPPIPHATAAAGKDGAGGKGSPPGGGAAGPDAHNVDKPLDQGQFDPSKAASKYDCGNTKLCDYKKHIAALLQQMPEAQRRAIEAALGVNGGPAVADDLLSACFVTGNFHLCKSMCSKPGVECSQELRNTTYWQACLSDGRPERGELACIKLCIQRENDPGGACVVDSGVWRRHCNVEPPQTDCASCPTSMEYGKAVWVPTPPSGGYWSPHPPMQGCHAPPGAGGTAAPAVVGGNLYPSCSALGSCTCCYNGSGNFQCASPSDPPQCANGFCPAQGPTALPSPGAPGFGSSNPRCGVRAASDPTDGVDFNWGVANEERHRLIMQEPPDEKGSMAQINLMLRYSPNDDYIMNIMSAWNIGSANDAGVRSMLTLADKYGKDMPYLAAAAWLRAAQIRQATSNGGAGDLYKHVLDLAKNNPKLKAYAEAAQAGINGEPPPPACKYGESCPSN